MGELEVQVGKLVLPGAKLGLDGLNRFLDILTKIPTPLKVIGVGLTAMFGFIKYGSGLMDTFASTMSGINDTASSFTGTLVGGSRQGLKELFGVGDSSDDEALMGIKEVEGTELHKYETPMGKLGQLVANIVTWLASLFLEMNNQGGKSLQFFGDRIKDVAGTVESLGTTLGTSLMATGNLALGADAYLTAGKGADIIEGIGHVVGDVVGKKYSDLAVSGLKNMSDKDAL